METDQQSNGRRLRSVNPKPARRRAARKLEGELGERCVNLLRELIEHPTNVCDHSSAYGVSRGRNHARQNHFAHVIAILLDVAVASEQPVEDLLMAKASLDSMIHAICDRVATDGPEDLMEAIRRESEIGAEDDVVTVEALSDGKIEPPEVPKMRRVCRRDLAATGRKLRALSAMQGS